MEVRGKAVHAMSEKTAIILRRRLVTPDTHVVGRLPTTSTQEPTTARALCAVAACAHLLGATKSDTRVPRYGYISGWMLGATELTLVTICVVVSPT